MSSVRSIDHRADTDHEGRISPVNEPTLGRTWVPCVRPELNRVCKHTRQDRVEVYIKMSFLKLGEIETAKEVFKASIFIQAVWKEPALNQIHRKGRHYELVNWSDYWNPELVVDNTVGETHEHIWYMVTYDHDGQATVVQKRTVRATFYESMELKQYPFDTQDLTVTVISLLGNPDILLLADQGEHISTMTDKDFADSSEWFLHENITYSVLNPDNNDPEELLEKETLSTPRRETKPETTAEGSYSLGVGDGGVLADTRVPEDSVSVRLLSGHGRFQFPRSTVSMACKATRKPLFFVLNVNLFIMILGALIFSTFAIDPTLVQGRLQTSATILLSNIAFKLAVTHTLPQVSYFTYLDFYILLSLMQMGAVCGWHAIVAQLSDGDQASDTAKLADKIAIIVLGCFYLIFNVLFLVTNLARVYRLKKIFRKSFHLDQTYSTESKSIRETRKVLPRR